MKALLFLTMVLICGTASGSETPDLSVASLVSRSDAVIVGQLRHHGLVCATGGIYAPQHFDVLAILTGTVPDKMVTVGFQWAPGERGKAPEIGEKMILFLKCPSVPVRAYWTLLDVHAGAQPYSQKLEATVRNLVAERR
jgi:hypothetical protein